ncbi:MAG: phosphoribosylformylglycinamidine cyclo-ligase [Armatimonadota bacterium]
MAEESKNETPLTYEASGVVPAEKVLAGLLGWVHKTLSIRQGIGAPALELGHYAAVLDLGNNLGIAVSTDGVGSKLLIAEAVGRYDTVGIDCVAMNVNDVLCVGAEPIAMVDYIAVESARGDVLEQVGKGLYEGARLANISIPGGELAQLPSIIRGMKEGEGLDLVGTCIGVVKMDQVITGDKIQPGDVLIGIASSGIHSNGLTLARKALLERAGLSLHEVPPGLTRTLGEELLEPTVIYAPWVLALLRSGAAVRGLAHITGDGFLNLRRIGRGIGWNIEWLPEPPPIFRLIQQAGSIAAGEMYAVFNMGVGFCVVVPESESDAALEFLNGRGATSWLLGRAVRSSDRDIVLRPVGLRSSGPAFVEV